jgi:hypothetical protein
LRARLYNEDSTDLIGVYTNSNGSFTLTKPSKIFINVRRSDSVDLGSGVILTSDYSMQLESGTTATAYTPYAVQVNPKPKKWVPKKNMFDAFSTPWRLQSGIGSNGYGKSLKTYITSPNNSRVTNDCIVSVKPNTTYSVTLSNPNIDYAYATGDIAGNVITDVGWKNRASSFTTDANTYYLAFVFRKLDNSNFITANDVRDSCNIQLEEGSTATPYEPYQLVTPRAKTGLSFNGQMDYFQIPSMTMDSIEIECMIDPNQPISAPTLLDARTGLANGHVSIGTISSAWSSIIVDGVDKTISKQWTDIPKGQRTKVKVIAPSSFTDDVTIFSNYLNSATNKLKATLYKVTCYLNNAIVAQYDFENLKNVVGSNVLPALSGGYKNLIPVSDPIRADLNSFHISVTNVSGINGFKNGLRFPDNSAVMYAYQRYAFNSTKTYTFSVFVKMDDGSAPVVGSATVGDLAIVIDGVVTSAPYTVTSVGNGVYRVSGTIVNPNAGVMNTGIVKYTGQSAKGFTISGWQLEEGQVSDFVSAGVFNTVTQGGNLIPSFEDARWTIHANAKVLGRDVLHLDATGIEQYSYAWVDVIPNSTYRMAINGSFIGNQRIRIGYGAGNPNVNTYLSAITNASGYSVTFTVPSGVTKISFLLDNNNTTPGSFDFIRPQLFQLSGKEGTLNGSPIQLNKHAKRRLYAKR